MVACWQRSLGQPRILPGRVVQATGPQASQRPPPPWLLSLWTTTGVRDTRPPPHADRNRRHAHGCFTVPCVEVVVLAVGHHGAGGVRQTPRQEGRRKAIEAPPLPIVRNWQRAAERESSTAARQSAEAPPGRGTRKQRSAKAPPPPS